MKILRRRSSNVVRHRYALSLDLGRAASSTREILPAGASLIETKRVAVLADVRAELERQGLGCPPRTEATIREQLADLLLGIGRRTV